MSETRQDQAIDQIDHIYHQLRRGLGHELVNDGNVFELIARAEQDGHPVLAQELREWQAPCDGAGQG